MPSCAPHRFLLSNAVVSPTATSNAYTGIAARGVNIACTVMRKRSGSFVGENNLFTGRVVVIGLAGGDATISNWDLVYKHQVQLIGFNLGVLIQHAPQIFGEVMGELAALIAAGVVTPTRATAAALADGPRALAALESRATVGKLALIP